MHLPEIIKMTNEMLSKSAARTGFNSVFCSKCQPKTPADSLNVFSIEKPVHMEKALIAGMKLLPISNNRFQGQSTIALIPGLAGLS